jgi:hypothetical protein
MRKYEKKANALHMITPLEQGILKIISANSRQAEGALILGTTHSFSMSVPLHFPMPFPLKICIATKNWLLNVMTKNPILFTMFGRNFKTLGFL